MVSAPKRAEKPTRAATPAWLSTPLLWAAAGAAWLAALAGWAGPESLAWAARQGLFLLQAVGAAAALWLLPGLALLRWLWPGRLAGLMRLAVALCAGLALPPLGLLLFDLVGLPWNRWVTLGYVAAAALALVLRSSSARPRLRGMARAAGAWPALALTGLSLLAVIGRLYLVRDLPVGLWGDSYHHTLMAQLLVDNQGLFTNWLPYASLATFTYHFGFHANVALFHWLTGLPVTQSVVVVGQLLSAATLPAAYALIAWLSRSQAAGLWAALLAGFINIQPAYYYNWGRYTQLTGQVLLAAVVIAWLAALERPRLGWRPVLLAAALTAGLLLTHYIVSLFAAMFLALYLLARLLRRPALSEAGRLALGGATIGGLALVLAAPWLANTLSGFLVRNAAGFVNGGVDAARIAGYATLTPIPPLMLKSYLMALGAVGFLIALAHRAWRVALLAAWAGLMLFAVVPYLVGLPGSGVIDSFVVYIALYLPVVPLAAYALGTAQGWAERWARRPALAAAGAALVAGSVWGYGWQLDHLYAPEHQLFTPADARAVDWIKANTPAEALFFVNAFPAYGGTLIAGSDGGWWLPLLAGRATNLPPLTYGSERGLEAGFAERVNSLAEALRGRPLTDKTQVALDLTTPDNFARLAEAGYDYVYNGAHAQPGPAEADHINVDALYGRPDLFHVVYAQDGVTIFGLGPAP